MPQKLYISSTFRDLKPYREHLLKALRFLTVDRPDFEVVTEMEAMMPGSDQPPLQDCLNYVRSCDIYILIFGKTYGSIDPDSGLSFTENEYLTARDVKKVFPFVANPAAEGLAGIPCDNEVEFNRFLSSVRSRYTTFVENFSNPDALALQVVTALYPQADRKWILRDSIKYCCNRVPNYNLFMADKKPKKLNVVTLTCRRNDRPEYFAQRIAFHEYGVDKEYNRTPLTVNNVIGSIASYTKHRKILINHLIDSFADTLPQRPATLEECCRSLAGCHVDNLFIQLYLTTTDTTNPILKSTLESFFTELARECERSGVTIFYFVICQFGDNEPLDDNISTWITDNPVFTASPGNVYDIDRLDTINRQDVEAWTERYLLPRASMKIHTISALDALLDASFSPPASNLSMDEAFLLLNKIILITNAN